MEPVGGPMNPEITLPGAATSRTTPYEGWTHRSPSEVEGVEPFDSPGILVPPPGTSPAVAGAQVLHDVW